MTQPTGWQRSGTSPRARRWREQTAPTWVVTAIDLTNGPCWCSSDFGMTKVMHQLFCLEHTQLAQWSEGAQALLRAGRLVNGLLAHARRRRSAKQRDASGRVALTAGFPMPEHQMRVVLGADPLFQPATGIGNYTRHLASNLLELYQDELHCMPMAR